MRLLYPRQHFLAADQLQHGIDRGVCVSPVTSTRSGIASLGILRPCAGDDRSLISALMASRVPFDRLRSCAGEFRQRRHDFRREVLRQQFGARASSGR